MEDLAKMIKDISPQLWTFAQRQAYILAWANTISAILSGTVLAGLTWLFLKFRQRLREGGDVEIPILFLALGVFTVLAVFLITGIDALLIWLNPEWKAVSLILCGRSQ